MLTKICDVECNTQYSNIFYRNYRYTNKQWNKPLHHHGSLLTFAYYNTPYPIIFSMNTQTFSIETIVTLIKQWKKPLHDHGVFADLCMLKMIVKS